MCATLPTWIVGRRYHAVEIKPGDAVLLCRDLGNAHDAQAIAVMDVRDRQCGHLPRFDAAGIAPLLDAGFIRLSGRAAAPDEGSRIALNLVIEFLPEGASRLFDPVASPASDAFHRTTLLWLWEHIRDMPSEEAVDVFAQLWKGVVPEETWGGSGALCYEGTLGETVPCESGKYSGEICMYDSRILWMWLY